MRRLIIASNGSNTVQQLASFLQVSASTVRTWIGKGLLTAIRSGRHLTIPEQPNAAFISARLSQNLSRPARTYVPPAISRYSEWHSVLDELTWLLKVCYSDTSDLKRKRFRMDVLFARYISVNRLNIKSIRSAFALGSGRISPEVWEDLQRGWYNELAFSFPPRASTLGVSFSDINLNQDSTVSRYLYPSWRITTAYYAIYFYLRGITRLKQPQFRLQEHGATLRNFKSCALNPLERTVWQFPLNIASRPGQRYSIRKFNQLAQPHLRYKYARHPRCPYHTAVESCRWIQSVFHKRGRAGGPTHYTMFDYLHDFRVWANYLEIEHLLNLRGPGYKAFLDQSLSLILFFVGGIAELVFLACSTETLFRNRCQRFFDVLAASSAELEEQYPMMPTAQRFELFKQLAIVGRGITYRCKPEPNRVRVAFNGGVGKHL